jgi:hypothetical protein
MISEDAKALLRGNPLGRELVGRLHSYDGFIGFHGYTNSIIIPERDYFKEINPVLYDLRKAQLLDFTFNGCGPNVWCFEGENTVTESRHPGFMTSTFSLNAGIRQEVADLLDAEFSGERNIQQIYEISLSSRSGAPYHPFDGLLKEIAENYSGVLNAETANFHTLKQGSRRYGYDPHGPQKKVMEWTSQSKPFILIDDKENISKLMMVAHGKDLILLAEQHSGGIDDTASTRTYTGGVSLYVAGDPWSDPFIASMIDRFDGHKEDHAATRVDLNRHGLLYRGPRHVLEQLCQHDRDLVYGFRV